MIGRRSAISMLIAFILAAVSAHGASGTESSSAPVHPSVSKLSIMGAHSSRTPCRAALSRFSPWRNRIKSVLPETYREINDESDFGSAILLDQVVTFMVAERASCHHDMRPPLRC